jgi:hypothetical protein
MNLIEIFIRKTNEKKKTTITKYNINVISYKYEEI